MPRRQSIQRAEKKKYIILLNTKILLLSQVQKVNEMHKLTCLVQREFAYPKIIGYAYLVISADYRGSEDGPLF